MQRIAIFASGTGTNADKIIAHFSNKNKNVLPALVVCNKPGAGVISIAEKWGIEVLLIEKEQFFTGDGYVNFLLDKKIDFIVLAGFLWKVPLSLIAAYPDKIINIHPALLPKYGGKGMYGNHVHATVIANKEKESGITIHYVNEKYDEGAIIFQAKANVDSSDTPETLASKIHLLEHEHFATTIENLLSH
ncbi:MAG: phosphoribosylglycinamide formyltransferase [Phycisphaerales bacterium]|nr:phosphoribosylglycinamide formyltransferase [Phycisphaerales bacterium]